jgi:DNA repair protein RadC
MLYLNRSNKVVAHKLISTGGVSGTVVDVKMVLKHGIETLATAMVAVHNHPSGNIKPSQADIELTRKIKEAAKLIEIILIDHLIIGEKKYYSFADEGMI